MRRYLARVIDSFVISAVIIGVFVAERALIPFTLGAAAGILINLLVFLVLWIGYGAALESSPWQATLGKRLTGLRVYNSDGGRITLSQSIGRNLLKDGPFLVFVLIPGGQVLSLIWLAAHLIVLHRSPVYQAIHDRLAHSWVAAREETIQLRLA